MNGEGKLDIREEEDPEEDDEYIVWNVLRSDITTHMFNKLSAVWRRWGRAFTAGQN